MNSFKKEERLCSQKVIGEMFISGNSFLCYPLKVIWTINPEIPLPAQTAFSVPKRNFKKSHDRNFLKRRLRESFRLRKEDLYLILNKKELQLALMIVYIGKEKSNYQTIDLAMRKVITRFEKELSIDGLITQP